MLEYASEELCEKRGQLHSMNVDDFTACFLFEKNERLQDIVHQLKYEEKTSFGIALGKRVGGKLLSLPQFVSADYLIPIPLHKTKLKERGYNQSDFIARGISSVTKISVATKFLSRTKYTQSQTKLKFQERRENVNDVFVVKNKFQKEIANKTVLLVDDVITTGATVSSASSALKASGAKNVYAVSAALTALADGVKSI